MTNLEILMLGNTRVGKTSMLSAMANELTGVNKNCASCILEPTDQQLVVLGDKWTELRKKIRDQKPFTTMMGGIEGAIVEFLPHPFEFKVKGATECTVSFVDTKGGLTAELNPQLIDRAQKAFGIICAIDTSFLMEGDDIANEEANHPKRIDRIFQKVFSNGDGEKTPAFVLFVLVKCEKYMRDSVQQQELLKKYHEKYDAIVAILKNSRSKVNAYVLAVQTMGCVLFSRFDKDGKPLFKVLPNSKDLAPVDCAYPLVLVMENVLEKLANGKCLIVRVFNRLMELVKLKTPITAYSAMLREIVPTPLCFEKL